MARLAQLGRLLDSLPCAAIVAAVDGCVLHETPSLVALLRREREAARVRLQARRAVLLVSALGRRHPRETDRVGGPVSSIVRTASCRYRVSAIALDAGFAAAEPTVLVTVEVVPEQPAAATELRARYRLTPRQMDIAARVMRGTSVPELAKELGISRHTARHHVEALRTKLGVHRAAAIAFALSANGWTLSSLTSP